MTTRPKRTKARGTVRGPAPAASIEAPGEIDEADVDAAHERKRVAAITARWHFLRFMASGVGLFIWRAYSTYRHAGLPVPESVLCEFDRWAAQLEEADSAQAVARAIDMASGAEDGKMTGPQRQARVRSINEQWNVVRHVQMIQHAGHSPSDAYHLAAKLFDKTPEAIRKQVERWNRQVQARLSAGVTDDADELLRMLGKSGRG